MSIDEHEFDLVVIGAGPGGYIAAIRAAQLGLKVACVEKEPALGGTCLRVGCIPSKALLESSELFYEARHGMAQHGIRVGDCSVDLAAMLSRKDKVVQSLTSGVDGLFKKHKISRFRGHARFERAGVVSLAGEQSATLASRYTIIATGSKSTTLPGIELDGARIGTSTEALSYDRVPQHLVVIGAGAIGLELGSVWRRLGAQVTVLEYLDRILPGIDGEVAAEAHKLFERQGLQLRTSSKVLRAFVHADECVVECEGAEPIRCDRVLVATGRMPNTLDLNLDALGIELDSRKRIPVDEHFETAVAGIYAIGDCIRGPMLAHKAMEEGVACVEYLVNGYGHVNYDAIPGVVYTQPEVAGVGKTEEELKTLGIEYRVGKFQFRAIGRARALGQTDGFVKFLADARSDRLLGVHIIGPRAGDLIAEAAVAIEFGASAEDIARSSHAHPTLAEAMKEAALDVAQRALHR